ncbi:MAG: aminoacetone oxidase family FAD-binding enzyme [Candidatus Bipolaricaulota bacterium]
MVWDVVVVGGGPAGLFAAISAAEAGARALVLERMPTPARKLLTSGGGACNLTHEGEIADLLAHYGGGDRPGDAGRFLRPALYAFSNTDLVHWCAQRGVPLAGDPAGRVFPCSRRAGDVLDLLLAEARWRRVELRTGVRVRSVRVERSRFVVVGSLDGELVVEGKTVVLATGGRSYPSLGATGDGYRLAVSLGHSVVPPRPALVPLRIERETFAPFTPCAGVSLSTALSLVRGSTRVAGGHGEILFTHRGLSGPAVLDLSRHVLPGDVVRVGLLPGAGDLPATEARLAAEIAAHGKRTVTNLLQGMGMVACLARALVSSVGLDGGTKAAELRRDVRHTLAASLAAGGEGGHPFPVRSVGGWTEAMVTAGGVRLTEVDPKTMGSRLVPGLFFAGEILDVDGDTGGYNLQAAFSTGRLAGRSAAEVAHTRRGVHRPKTKRRRGTGLPG